MPRIRRWHPVSHDFVRDREVQELRRRFGHWLSDVWLEMLSEADRNLGLVKGDKESIGRSLAWVSLSIKPAYYLQTIGRALEYMEQKGWITPVEGGYLVRNYPEYHQTREAIKSRKGTKKLPSYTVLPNALPKDKEDIPTGPLNGWPDEWAAVKGRILTLPYFTNHPERIAWIKDLEFWQTKDEKLAGAVKDLDALLMDAVDYLVKIDFKPISRRAFRQKLGNCLDKAAEFADAKAKRDRSTKD